MGRANKNIIINDINIFGIADKGFSIGKTKEGEVVFVENAVPGDIVNARVLRKSKGSKFCTTTELIVPSPHRVEPECKHFGICGGCKWQNLDYKEQARQKEIVVQSAMSRIGKFPDAIALPIISSEHIYEYRNKLEYTFSNKKWLMEKEVNSNEKFDNRNGAGFHKSGAFDKVVDIEKCLLQDNLSNKIRNWVRDYAETYDYSFYDIKENKGIIRNLIIRMTDAGETMVILVFGAKRLRKILFLMDAFVEKFKKLNSVYYVINEKQNDTILDQELVLFKGSETIKEVLGEVSYYISPKSFFQTNSKQAKVLYDVVAKFADLNGTENVYDLYTGTGSIACYVAKKAKKVVAIEEVKEAIDDAYVNAAINNIDNITFYCGDVKNILTKEFHQTHGAPDVVITDPPRAGMHEDVVNMLLELSAPKVVYVSCNPSTQGRDLKLLAEKYDLVTYQPVDMFPHTHHIENVALLTLKK